MIERKTYKNKIIHWVYEWIVLTYEITENGKEKLLFATTGNSDSRIIKKLHKNFFDKLTVWHTITQERYNEEWTKF